LIRAKEAVPHGQWQRWLADNFDQSDRTAQRFMQLAANPSRVAHLPSMRAAVGSLGAEACDSAGRAGTAVHDQTPRPQ
jgi:hypothetical protein